MDLLGYLAYLTKVGFGFKGRHDLPAPVPRPGGLPGQAAPKAEPEPVRFSTREEIREFFQGPGTSAVHTEN